MISEDGRAALVALVHKSGDNPLAIERAETLIAKARERVQFLNSRGHIGYADEVQELRDLANELESAVRSARGLAAGVVRRVPKRVWKLEELYGVAEAGLHRSTGLRDPERGEVLVVRAGQMVMRRCGRARVEDAYEVLIGGRVVTKLPRRMAMYQAHLTSHADFMGMLPSWLTLPRRARARYLHKRRWWKRTRQAFNAAVRRLNQSHLVPVFPIPAPSADSFR